MYESPLLLLQSQTSIDIVFSFFYWLVMFCFVACSNEFQAAGLTIQNMFSKRLGSENVNFVLYHMKRTVLTVIVHSSLPLGYFLCMSCITDSGIGYRDLGHLHVAWQIYFYVSCAVFFAGVTLAYFWRMNNYQHHPLVRNLTLYHRTWQTAAQYINPEFRSIDKYTNGFSGSSRIVVTTNWIIKSTAYYMHVVHQDHCTLTVVETKEFTILPDSTSPRVQYVKIKVHPSKQEQKMFDIRILSTEYSDFRNKIFAQIIKLPSVNIHKSSAELFLDVWKEHVVNNPFYHVSEERIHIGQCMGCNVKQVDVKLTKLCADEGDGECEDCKCNPLWCLECMGRWFTSRQDQQKPSQWLSGHATCPMCRAKFCILDVCRLQVH